MTPEIKVYALSTCHHCAAAKEYLDARAIPYDCVYVDRLYAEERNETMPILRKLNPALSFPTIVIGDRVIAGFIREEIEDALKKYDHG
jgi:glutaredoxin-like protein NrdH